MCVRAGCVVARYGLQGRHHVGQQPRVGVCGDGVYGVGAVVIGKDRSEVLGGSVFGATACLVDDGVAAMGVLVGFIGDSG